MLEDKEQNTAENLCERLLQIIDFGVIAVNAEGYVLFINDFARRMLNFKADGSDGAIRFEDVIPETFQESWPQFQKIFATGQPQINVLVEYGGETFVSSRYPIIDAGKMTGIVSIFSQMETYKEIVNDLFQVKEYADRIEAIIDSSYDGIYVTDGDANTIMVNSAYEKITGLNVSDLIGRNMRDLVKEGYYDESVSLRVLGEKKPVTIRQILKSGKNILVTGNPIFDEDANIKMVVTNVRDMTDLVELQQQLEYTKGMSMAYRDVLKSIQQSAIRDNDLIMVSEAMLRVQEVIRRVSQTNANVLIYGETGVGKDRIAEEIHEKSGRLDSGIFVKINCGAIPETLLESELFGYERGAFTGARKEGKPGLFEVAHNGTLFLDEVESMPMVLQSKLLRVLQNFEITKVGSTKPIKVDVRLICASNQDLKELIDKKEFRADLFYRLNVIPIYVPPLRERKDDIPYLIHFFLDRYNKAYNKKRVISREAMDLLLAYPWPGNVREVVNVIERLVIISHGNYILPNNLPKEIFEKPIRDVLDKGISLKDHLESIELSIITKAIDKYGSARKAASYLGVDSTTLTRKLKRNKQQKSTTD